MTDAHDLVAELIGYRNELEGAERKPAKEQDKDVIKSIRARIAAIEDLIEARAHVLEANAMPDLTQVDRLRAALSRPAKDAGELTTAEAVAVDEENNAKATGKAPLETAVPTGPQEQAVPAAKGSGK